MPDSNYHDFDGDNSRKLRQLDTEVIVAARAEASAEAVNAVLTTRLQAFQAAATAARTSASLATTDLGNAHTTTQTVAHTIPQADDARQQAEKVTDKVGKLIDQVYVAALAMVDASQKIGQLVGIVDRKPGKNEVKRESVVSGSLQAKTNAEKALVAVNAALRSTLLAYAAAMKAKDASTQFIESNKRLRGLLAPQDIPAKFNATNPASGQLWTQARIKSIHDLPPLLDGLTVLQILDAIAGIAADTAAEREAALTQVALELNTSRDRLNRSTARVAAASAAYAAAEAAVP